VSAELPVQQVEQGFLLGCRFGRPQVVLARPDNGGGGGGRLVVDDAQGPPVAGAFVAVPVDLGAAGILSSGKR